MAEHLDAALRDKFPCVLATAAPDGTPDVGFKGSVMVFDEDLDSAKALIESDEAFRPPRPS